MTCVCGWGGPGPCPCPGKQPFLDPMPRQDLRLPPMVGSQGWVCPRCGVAHAPWVSRCDCKKTKGESLK